LVSNISIIQIKQGSFVAEILQFITKSASDVDKCKIFIKTVKEVTDHRMNHSLAVVTKL